MQRQNPESLQPPPIESRLRINPVDLGLGQLTIDSESFNSNARDLVRTPGVDLRTLIDELPHGDNASTLVGQSDSGKSEIMNRASMLLGVPHVDAGLLFRTVTAKAIEFGYVGGDVDSSIGSALLSSIDEMDITLGNPKDGVEQAIELNGVRYVYSGMDSIDRGLLGDISQNGELYTATMDRLVQETDGKLVIVGGRSINQHIPDSVAKFYIERDGSPRKNEAGSAWSLDDPSSEGMMTIVNREGAVEDSARAVSLILARRVESRLSGNTKYSLSNGVSIVTGEEAKVREVEFVINSPESVAENEPYLQANIDTEFLKEMSSMIEAKARNARLQFPEDQHLMVESTGLFIPKLHEMGIPPEVLEYMSKYNYQTIFDYAGAADTLDAYSVTVAAVIDQSGNITSTLGLASGTLQAEQEGAQGFGWDAQFVPAGYDQTYSSMGDEKHSISSRAMATHQLFTA